MELLGKLTEKVDSMDGRLDRLETTQAEMKAELTEVHDIATKVAVTQEGVVLPRIQLALDGHSELKRKLETLATKEQVKALADSVDVIKDVVRQHSGDIRELKKVQ